MLCALVDGIARFGVLALKSRLWPEPDEKKGRTMTAKFAARSSPSFNLDEYQSTAIWRARSGMIGGT